MRCNKVFHVFRWFIVGVLMLPLLSCSSHLRTTITTFQDGALPIAVGTFHVVPFENTPASEQLKFGFYKKQLEDKLKHMGFSLATDTEAQYTVYLSFSTTRREKDQKHSDVHFRGLYARGRGHGSGGIVIRDFRGHEFEYVRRVQIGMEEKSSAHKLVEIDAVSFGECNQMPSVFSPMLDAIFENFWRTNGSVEKVVVPANIICK